MARSTIFRAFRHFRGSGAWAASVLDVSRQTVSAWLMDKKTSRRLDEEMPKLAAELIRTKGRCITGDINGKSVRSQLDSQKHKGKKK